MAEWITKLRWRIARTIMPKTTTVIVELGSHQHVVKRVTISASMRVKVPALRKRSEETVDYGGRTLSMADVDAIIGAGTASEGQDPFPAPEGTKIERLAPDVMTPERLAEIKDAWACEHDWQDDSSPDADRDVSMMKHGRTCRECGAWEP